MFKFEPFRKLHLAVFKLVTEYTVSYLLYDRLTTKIGRSSESFFKIQALVI